MKQKPILFSSPMVLALIAGTKTQTRRIKKPKNQNYEVGDILWVRESWALAQPEPETYQYRYKADRKLGAYASEAYQYHSPDAEKKWRPSIHMPKEAARIFLKVTNIKTQLLHDITVADAIAEGCHGGHSYNAKTAFLALWDGIHGDFASRDNVTVLVIEFEVFHFVN